MTFTTRVMCRKARFVLLGKKVKSLVGLQVGRFGAWTKKRVDLRMKKDAATKNLTLVAKVLCEGKNIVKPALVVVGKCLVTVLKGPALFVFEFVKFGVILLGSGVGLALVPVAVAVSVLIVIILPIISLGQRIVKAIKP